MKLLMSFILLALSYSSFSSFIQDGKYYGVKEENGAKCSIEFFEEASYALVGRVEYRITIHTKGPFIKCLDDEKKEFDYCASGEQSNGQMTKSLYIVGSKDKGIEKIYFQSGHEFICRF